MGDACARSVVAAVALVFGAGACDLAEAVAGHTRRSVAVTPDLSLHRLGRELWLHESWSRVAGSRRSRNGLVVVGNDAVILVDVPREAEATTALADWIEGELGLPIRLAVITHATGEPTGGTAVLAAREIASIGCDETVLRQASEGGPLPSRSFAKEELLTLDDETIELFFPGPANRPDGVVVYLRRAKLLFCGDLVRPLEADTLGSTRDADLSSWPTALRFVRGRFSFAERVVPGHGDPGGPELIEHTLALIGSRTG